MQLTNNHNLPASIVDALTGDDFDLTKTSENILWLTKLIGSPKCSQLERRHWGELKEDVADRVFRIIGQGVHSIVERYQNDENRLTEEKAYVDCESMEVHTLPVGGKLKDQKWYSDDKIFLSLRLDCYDGTDCFVEDYKVTSVWGVIIEGQPKPEWIAQNSIAAWVLRKIGFEVKGLRNILFLRDWSAGKVGTDPKYPEIPIHIYKYVSIWSDKKTEDYIRERVKLHVAAMALKDDEIPVCSPEERWAKAPVWALMKEGRKTAVKLYYTEFEANAAKNAPGLYVEYRPGEDVKCNSYCTVCNVCNWFKAKGGK